MILAIYYGQTLLVLFFKIEFFFHIFPCCEFHPTYIMEQANDNKGGLRQKTVLLYDMYRLLTLGRHNSHLSEIKDNLPEHSMTHDI